MVFRNNLAVLKKLFQVGSFTAFGVLFSKRGISSLPGQTWYFITSFFIGRERKKLLYIFIKICNQAIGYSVIFYCNKTNFFISFTKLLYKRFFKFRIFACKIRQIHYWYGH